MRRDLSVCDVHLTITEIKLITPNHFATEQTMHLQHRTKSKPNKFKNNQRTNNMKKEQRRGTKQEQNRMATTTNKLLPLHEFNPVSGITNAINAGAKGTRVQQRKLQ